MSTDAVGALATYVLAQSAGCLVDEVVNYHSVNVNTRELSITQQWFEKVGQVIPKPLGVLKASVELPENLRERPGPEVYARAFGRAGGG